MNNLEPGRFLKYAMDRNTYSLWYAYPNDLLDDALAESCASLLSRDEMERLQFLRFGRSRREFLAARVNLRCALSHCVPVPPRDWQFQSNDYGKPEIDPNCGLCFNVSHASELALCVIGCRSRVGVDVESLNRADEIASIASDVFSSPELAQFESLRGSAKLQRALSLWTLKEAYVKALGKGFSLPLKKFSFLFGGAEGIRLVLDPSWCDDARSFRFCLLNHYGHRIAVATEGTAHPDLQMWQARPLLGSPVRMVSGREQWF